MLKLSKTAILMAALAVPVAMAVAAAPFPLPKLSDAPRLPDGDISLTETYCDPREVVASTLEHDFSEKPRLAALTESGLTMELWASDLLGTWTVVHHGGDGISCIVTSGQAWAVDANAVRLLDSAMAEAVYQS